MCAYGAVILHSDWPWTPTLQSPSLFMHAKQNLHWACNKMDTAYHWRNDISNFLMVSGLSRAKSFHWHKSKHDQDKDEYASIWDGGGIVEKLEPLAIQRCHSRVNLILVSPGYISFYTKWLLNVYGKNAGDFHVWSYNISTPDYHITFPRYTLTHHNAQDRFQPAYMNLPSLKR